MTLEERYEDAKKDWTDAVQPQTALERRLVKFISCQDWLLHRSLMRAMSTDDEWETPGYEQRQHDFIQSIGCLVETIAVMRQSSATAPPKRPASTGKVVEMPKRSSTSSVGTEPPPEGAPALHPFFPARSSGDKKPKSRKLEFLRDAA